MKKSFWKILGLVLGVVLVSGLVLGVTTASAGVPKVGVCKYSHTPQGNEVLQTYNEVASSTLKDWDGHTFPYEFTDAQGKSVAIGWADEVSIEDCDGYTPPEPNTRVKGEVNCFYAKFWIEEYIKGRWFSYWKPISDSVIKHYWTNDNELESWTEYYLTLNEPEYCLPEVSYHKYVDCEKTFVTEWTKTKGIWHITGFDYFYWEDPYTLESVTLLGQLINEPDECLVSYYITKSWSNCERGAIKDYKCLNGECEPISGTYQQFNWEKPYDVETHTFVSKTTEEVIKVFEPERCDLGEECENVVSQGKVYGDLYNVGQPVWGDWINHLNGITYRTGTQYIASDWTETFVDELTAKVCSVDEGTTKGETELYEEHCSPRWTGEWVQTYLRTVRGNWVTYCNLLVPDEADTNEDGKISEKEAKAWEWSDSYLAEKCTLSCEIQQWQGKLLTTNREMNDICGVVHERGTLFGGNHYDTSCGIFDYCSTLDVEQ